MSKPQARSTGVSYPAINASEVEQIPIPLPSEDEQQAIASFLDEDTKKIDDLIEAKLDLLALLKEKRQTVIIHAVTKGLNPDAKLKPSGIDWLGDIPEHWEVVPVMRLARDIQTGPFGSQLHESDYIEDGIPLVNPAHIIDGMFMPQSTSSVELDTAERLARHRLCAGDIVGEIGRCAVVTEGEAGWLCGTGCMVVRLSSGAPLYFWRVFRTQGFSEFLALNAVGTNMLNLNPSIVRRMIVPVPPSSEQHAIAVYLDAETAKLARLSSSVESAIKRLQEYRTALISAAVTGKIDVRNYSAAETEEEMLLAAEDAGAMRPIDTAHETRRAFAFPQCNP